MPWLVCVHQQSLVATDVAGPASRCRPETAAAPESFQHCVRHQSRDAAIAVVKRMNPKEPVMRRRDCHHLAYLREILWVVRLLKPGEKTRQVRRSGREMLTDNYFTVAEHTRFEAEGTLRFWIFHMEKFLWQSAA